MGRRGARKGPGLGRALGAAALTIWIVRDCHACQIAIHTAMLAEGCPGLPCCVSHMLPVSLPPSPRATTCTSLTHVLPVPHSLRLHAPPLPPPALPFASPLPTRLPLAFHSFPIQPRRPHPAGRRPNQSPASPICHFLPASILAPIPVLTQSHLHKLYFCFSTIPHA